MNEDITKEAIGEMVVFHGGAGSDRTWSVEEITPGKDSTLFKMVSEDQLPIEYEFERHGYGDSLSVVRNILKKAIRVELERRK